MICTGYEVNAFVAGWKVQTFANIRRHLAQQPDLSQDGSVFWLGLEVELDEPLERATLLGVGELPRPLPEILPRRAGGNESVHAVHEVARKSAKANALNLSVLTNDFISFSPDVSLQYCQLQNLPIFLPL